MATSTNKSSAAKRPLRLKPLMKANFCELVALNFPINPDVLRPHIPPGLELNFFKDETYVSLVAMMLRDVRVWGIPIHIATGFEEFNLRFYVKRKVGNGEYRTGSCFLKDYVSGSAAAWILGSLFKAPFSKLKFKHNNTGFKGVEGEIPNVDYQWQVNEKWNRIRIKGRNIIQRTGEDTKVGFIINSQNVYSCKNRVTSEYKVEHSKPWVCWNAAQASFDCDAARLFGEEFVKALARRPASVFMAEGSEVTIYRPHIVHGQPKKTK